MNSYHRLLANVLNEGERHNDRTGVGTLSVFGRQWRHHMAAGFPLLTTKKMPLRWIFEELKWFLSGSTTNADLRKKKVTIWEEWSDIHHTSKFNRPVDELGPIYGKLWRDFGKADPYDVLEQPGCSTAEGVDQIAWLLNEIKTNPNSRRLIVSGWHPFLQTRVALPPCHTLWQVKCHEVTKTMSLQLYARSIDIFLGLPFNIASYALLLEMICYVTHYIPRELVISFGDLHLYTNHIDQAHLQLSREPLPLPTLMIDQINHEEDPLKRLLSIEWEDIVLRGYKNHPAIKADVAI